MLFHKTFFSIIYFFWPSIKELYWYTLFSDFYNECSEQLGVDAYA